MSILSVLTLDLGILCIAPERSREEGHQHIDDNGFYFYDPRLLIRSYTSIQDLESRVEHAECSWLQTDLGSQNADLPVSTGVESVKDIILSSTPAQNGKFVTIKVPGWEDTQGPNKYHGGENPW
ncbi:hypothetical protein AC579_4849 [Pseudocercospora musae]|uniref:Uncharacterized protein n=1 Tax=Pseudocercospora musae TaxID=113226 RepID=A0A139IKT7_9PEZI|nr:hypothetical protein AC579_4849 [Pseudocercospora musae]KXT15253.1 hypothetical protein AC579_4849 [Pseudocercospora musae]KXT15255.1 hypothetical protein AC579_4849 [Pseudocercospora musae]